MSVISSSIKLLFCEGKDESLDYQILNRVMGTLNTVIPSGGKVAMGAFIQGRLSSYGEENSRPSYLAFRDRDFDAEPPSTIGLITPFPDKPIFLTYRACIENYLLDSSLIHNYWAESVQGPRWQHGESPGADNISDWIRRSARSITDYQAVRWALARLKPSERWPEVNTTWTKGSGYLPNSLQLEYCLEEAKNLITTYSRTVRMVNEAEFERHLNSYREKFQKDEFWNQEQYLVWFHGKDLKKAMQKDTPNTISLKSFFIWATQYLEITKYPDLVELRNRVQQG